MNEVVFSWLNGFNDSSRLVNATLAAAMQDLFKAGPYMIVLWGLWFRPGTPEARAGTRNWLLGTILTAAVVVAVTRVLAEVLPFSLRPLHTEGLEIRLQDWQSVIQLDGWSSMPSDHASLFMGLAVSMLMISRGAGVFLVLWAIFLTSLPRVVVGLHWPVDVAAGWAVGAVVALVVTPVLAALVRRTGIVPFFEAREWLGYPLLFVATFEIAQMFAFSRWIVESLTT